jgi:membrane-associated phospholipid phosphatase
LIKILIFSYIAEYGFPSTHAMFATGIPFALVLLSHQRYDVNLIQLNDKKFINFIFSLIYGLD